MCETTPVATARGRVFHWLVLIIVLAIAGIYVGVHISRGWVPADDGILGESALRVMRGQLPHRDFAEIYTGGLSVIHALAFRVFGVNLMSLRICAFLFFLAWIPAVYSIASRFVSSVAAGLITLLAVAWSFPNYPASMPSWYNLFFATFGALALLRYLDVRKLRWICLAGICGGASILIKVIGAYYIAAVLLFLAFLEQSDLQNDDLKTNYPQSGEQTGHLSGKFTKAAYSYRVFSGTALLLFIATVVYVFHARLGNGELYQFVLPSLVLVAVIFLGERNAPNVASTKRFGRLLRLVIPFCCGVLAPIAIFLVPYARSGAVTEFFAGVTSSALARSVGLGVIRPAGLDKGFYTLLLVGLVSAAMYLRQCQGRVVGSAFGLGLLVIAVKTPTLPRVVSGVWYSVATLTPLLVLLGSAVLLAHDKRGGAAAVLQRQRVMLLISIAAMCTLVQYPFAAPIYLCYALPLTLLAAVAVVTTARKQPGSYLLASIAGFYLLFAVVMLIPDHVYELTHKVGPMEKLHLERAGGLHIEYAASFADLIHLLQQHSPNGLMYAGNDCPELYFLSGLKNVTEDDGGAASDEVLKALQSDDLNLVVINEAPFFPGARMSPEVRAEVSRKFPHDSQYGIFHVFWKQ
ncbi:MAG TPA: glycosyltransferase family 39 protein [Terriglobales bacterium]|nr:glycosyltransferase family 39 protein [Terriglobales bacterium]